MERVDAKTRVGVSKFTQFVPASRRTVIMKFFFIAACIAKQIAEKAMADAIVPTMRLVRAAGRFSTLALIAAAGLTVA